MENAPHTTGRMTRARARHASQTPGAATCLRSPAPCQTAKAAFQNAPSADLRAPTPRKALFDISNQTASPAVKSAVKPAPPSTPKPAEEQTVGSAPVVEPTAEPVVQAVESPVTVGPTAAPLVAADSAVEEPVRRDAAPVEVKEQLPVAENVAEVAPAPVAPVLSVEPVDEILVDYAELGTPSMVVLKNQLTAAKAPEVEAPPALCFDEAATLPEFVDAVTPEDAEVGAAASYPPSPSSSAKDRWAMESPWQGTTPGTWAAGYKAEEGADRSAMPASVVVPTADFEPRSIKELQRAIKEAAAARQPEASEVRHNEWADGDWEDGEEEYAEDGGDWTEYEEYEGDCDWAEEADDIAQILGGMSLAASVPCDPVPQGQHLRFEEELDGAAVVSPTRSRVVLRGVPEPEGTHVVFN